MPKNSIAHYPTSLKDLERPLIVLLQNIYFVEEAPYHSPLFNLLTVSKSMTSVRRSTWSSLHYHPITWYFRSKGRLTHLLFLSNI